MTVVLTLAEKEGFEPLLNRGFTMAFSALTRN